MAEETDMWIELVRKLKELTENGKLRWHSVKPTQVMPSVSNRRVSTVFETEYNDRILRLYSTQASAYASEYTVLELVDENEAVWEFPNIAGLDDLLETVKFQAAGVKEFIKAVLAEETSRP